MRYRAFTVPATALVLVVSLACGGDDNGTPAPDGTGGAGGSATEAPSATPFARVPDPIVVTGDGAPSGGGGATEDAVSYTVEAGDSLGAISARFGVDVEVIQAANNLDGVDIFIGQELTIPRGSTGGAPTATTTPGATSTQPGGTQPSGTPPSGVDTYTVQDGDTAFGIALQFDTTVEALEAANGVDEGGLTDLQIGQVINLPRP